ncbi:hypothetical protein ACRYCC_26000 [Actinomadura scrupuli]|uniref:recombination directionality factor n=1 Tax=Actinomadura scrupuli TaxID=559629 RepID=UPI003D96FAE6
MPILDIQKRARELGRIRLGQVQPTEKGGTRPAKIDKFRLTSASKPLLEKVAALYGGTVEVWTPANGGPSAWEVFTQADRLPILVPPQPVSQWYELWSGGGCKRRCDGQREIISESACICAQADERICKPTTRLNVVLKDVEGIGVFRLESHGYYAATELPNVAAFLEQAGTYVSAWLVLEERIVKKEGEKPKRFMVPAIEVEGVTPGQLISGEARQAVTAGQGQAAVAGADAPAVGAAAQPAIAGAVEKPAALAGDPARASTWIAGAQGCQSIQDLTGLLAQAQGAGFAKNVHDESDSVARAFVTARARLTGSGSAPAAAPAPAAPAPAAPASERSRAALWTQAMALSPFDRTSELEEAFAALYQGATPGTAELSQLEGFLASLQAGDVKPIPAAAPTPSGTESEVPF